MQVSSTTNGRPKNMRVWKALRDKEILATMLGDQTNTLTIDVKMAAS